MSDDPRTELEATLAARRELGSGHDEELISGFLERLESRLGERRARPPKPHDPNVSAGMRFALREGGRTIGAGIITAVS